MNQKQWWHSVGSGIIPRKDDDMESHAKRVSVAAWDSAVNAIAESTQIHLTKPGSEGWLRVYVDNGGNLKFEEIPISKIRKEIK